MTSTTLTAVSFAVMKQVVFDRMGSPWMRACALLPLLPFAVLCCGSVILSRHGKLSTDWVSEKRSCFGVVYFVDYPLCVIQFHEMYNVLAGKLDLPREVDGSRFKEYLTLLHAQGLLQQGTSVGGDKVCKCIPGVSGGGGTRRKKNKQKTVESWSMIISREDLMDAGGKSVV